MEALRKELMADDKKAKGSQAKADQGQEAKSRTIAEIRAKKKGVTKKVTIQIDGEIAAEIEMLQAEYALAKDFDRKRNEPETAPKVLEKIDALIEESRDTEVTFTFKGIGGPAYDELLSEKENQPSEEDRKIGADFNPATFPPAIVAASCIDPVMTLEEAQEIFVDPDWNGAELQRLFFGALSVNTELGDIPLSRGVTGSTANSLLNSIIASKEGSPTPFS